MQILTNLPLNYISFVYSLFLQNFKIINHFFNQLFKFKFSKFMHPMVNNIWLAWYRSEPHEEVEECSEWGREWRLCWRFQRVRLFLPRSSICDRRFPRSKSTSSSNSHTLPPPNLDSTSDSPPSQLKKAAVVSLALLNLD